MRQYNRDPLDNQYYRPPRRKKRRRLKKSVKRALALIVTIIIILIFRPWHWFSGWSGRTDIIAADTVRVPLNQILSNMDSDLPQAAKFDKAVNQFIRKWDIRGASLAIMKDGNLIYSKGYGYADVKNQVPMEVRHIMRIASLSKLITAVGVMKLYEDGKLKLTDRVFGPGGILSDSTFAGYTDKKINEITVDNLLRHQAGFSVRAGDPMFLPLDVAKAMGRHGAVDMNTMISYGLNRGIRYKPGTRTIYSNMGYLILSKVIEQASGLSYENYIQDSILKPIGCYDMHIGYNNPEDKFENEVCYYETEDAELIPACDGSNRMVAKSGGGNDVRGLMGAGAWVVSPTEMLKFVAAIDGDPAKPDILKKETIRLMTTDSESTLPIGWMRCNKDGDWTRTGTMAGTNALLKKQSNGYTWVFIANTSSWKGPRFHHQINTMLKQAFDRVSEWPEKDMFAADSIINGLGDTTETN